MKIQEQHVYHGAGLVQIVEHESFKALNRASGKYGHYLVNTDRHVFAKYSTRKKSPWPFTFQPDDLATIAAESKKDGAKTFVMLTCGGVTVCTLTFAELVEVVDLESEGQQNITVDVSKGGSCHVHGSRGKMKKTVPHNAHPKKVFA